MMTTYEPAKPIAEMSWDELVEHNRRRLAEATEWAAEMKQAASDIQECVQLARALVTRGDL